MTKQRPCSPLRSVCRNVPHLAVLGTATALAAAVSTGCVARNYHEDEQLSAAGSEPLAVTFAAPRRNERTIRCVTGDKPARGLFRNQEVEYRSSDDVNYFSRGWTQAAGALWNGLDGVIGLPSSQVRVVAIDIRNVGGKPHYLYLSNGTQNDLLQPWSSSKVWAITSAFHRIRLKSRGQVGGNSTVAGTSVPTLVSDLVTVSSNPIAGWFKRVGGFRESTALVRNWILPAPDVDFGGLYGENGINPGGGTTYNFRSLSNGNTVSVPQSVSGKSNNALTALVKAEMLKRLAVNTRDSKLMPKLLDYSASGFSPETARATSETSLQDEDIATLFYGDSSRGGMAIDGLRGDLIQGLGGSTQLDKLTGGSWRLFGKTGSGDSGSRGRAEAAYLGYACLPEYDGGREFAFYVHISLPLGGGNKYAVRRAVVSQVVDALVPGFRSGESAPPPLSGPGKATAREATVIKRQPVSSTSLAAADKCSLPPNATLGYRSRSSAPGSHSLLQLTSPHPSCPQLKEVYVYEPHFNFAD